MSKRTVKNAKMSKLSKVMKEQQAFLKSFYINDNIYHFIDKHCNCKACKS